MMPSNSTAKIESQGDLERGVEGAGAVAQRRQVHAQSGIRHKTQFCALTRSRLEYFRQAGPISFVLIRNFTHKAEFGIRTLLWTRLRRGKA